MNENQMQSIMIIFMANIIGGQMLSTGAFEIYLEEDLVFSKLQTGGLPQLDQLADMVGRMIQSQ
jgi:selT/selW/selH-like putative selenoprotein